MSQAFICDTCQKHVEPTKGGFNLPPKGWYQIFSSSEPTTHFCSPECLSTYAECEIEKKPVAVESQA